MNRRKREEQILDASIRVFAKRGYKKTNVSELVDEAQVARGTFYLYFKSKQHVLDRLVERFMTDLMQSVSKINSASYLMNQNLKAYFRAASSDLIVCLTKNHQLARLILLHSDSLEPKMVAKIAVYTNQLVRIIKNNIDSGVRSGLFRPLNTDVAALSMIGSVKESLFHWMSQGETFELETHIASLIDYLLAGLAPQYQKATQDVAAAAQKARLRDANMH